MIFFSLSSFQLAAPLEILGKAAAELKFKKQTRIGNIYEVFVLKWFQFFKHGILVYHIFL